MGRATKSSTQGKLVINIFLTSNAKSVVQGVLKGAESESEISLRAYTLINHVLSLWCQKTGSGYCRVTYGLKISDDIRRSLVSSSEIWKIVHQWNRIRDQMLLFQVVFHFMDIKHIIIVYEPPVFETRAQRKIRDHLQWCICSVKASKRATFSP